MEKIHKWDIIDAIEYSFVKEYKGQWTEHMTEKEFDALNVIWFGEKHSSYAYSKDYKFLYVLTDHKVPEFPEWLNYNKVHLAYFVIPKRSQNLIIYKFENLGGIRLIEKEVIDNGWGFD